MNKRLTSKVMALVATGLLGLAGFQAVAHPNRLPVFDWENLDSDIHGVASFTDANLVNPWGLAPGEDGKTIWVADNGTGLITRYTLDGEPFVPKGATQPEVITVPPNTGNATGVPSGLVLDHAAFDPKRTNEFLLPVNGTGAPSKPSQLLLVTEDGEIAGFNPDADPTSAIVMASVPGAVYKGLALAFVDAAAGQPQKHRLFAANFGANKIDVFESDFSQVTLPNGKFVDPHPVSGFSPFNIERYSHKDPVQKTIVRVLLVTYAKVNPLSPHDDLAGPGNGYINVFKTDGAFVGRLVDHTSGDNGLNSPWGMAISRGGKQSDDRLLVGNFGDGSVHFFSLNGVFANTLSAPAPDQGPLLDPHGNVLTFDGLWALHFSAPPESIKPFARDDDELGPETGKLFFSAGLKDESDGLMGRMFKVGEGVEEGQ